LANRAVEQESLLKCGQLLTFLRLQQTQFFRQPEGQRRDVSAEQQHGNHCGEKDEHLPDNFRDGGFADGTTQKQAGPDRRRVNFGQQLYCSEITIDTKSKALSSAL
jgi:hypothetical protein